jgi:hypothetical protein
VSEQGRRARVVARVRVDPHEAGREAKDEGAVWCDAAPAGGAFAPVARDGDKREAMGGDRSAVCKRMSEEGD